ncbi:alpha-2-HS-glycoprotein 1 [Salvelinus namaycush]|uniref:Alpha-2-HS-glycoprotein 1 n=1 Tax=Salvelinus namaycush TaxID=8040 RepID=A0A8U1BTP1_SALNM|nr:alpha-2-HS-glycoprotein 1 [Salvelinus namaycush]
MRGLVILSVLTVCALNCATVPTRDTSGRHWSCDENEKEPGARLAMLSINNKHFHGYKFQLSNITSSTVEKGLESDCKLHLDLDLKETTCHIINPKSFEECDIRQHHETQVNAHCNVTLSITEGIAEVSKHSCNTEPVSAEKVIRMCPDCPILLPLHSPEGLESVKAGLRQFNMDHNYTSYFKLMEVGRIISGYMMMTGMYYNAELAIVETECNAKSRIDTQACKPLCPDEARHGLCKSTLLGNGQVDVTCEIYEALNASSPRTPGRGCGHPPHRSGNHTHPGIKHHLPPWVHKPGKPGPLPGPPPGDEGPPPGPHSPPTGPHNPPPGPHNPPTGPHNPPPGPHGEFPFPHCHGFVKIPPSIHPLCPFPPPHHPHPHPRPHGHGPPPGHSLPPHPTHVLGEGPPPHVKA